MFKKCKVIACNIYTSKHNLCKSTSVTCCRMCQTDNWLLLLVRLFGCRTSLPVTLSRDHICFHVISVRTVVNISLFIRNPYMFLMTSRYSESLFIWTFVYGRSIRITHRDAEIRMLKGEWGHS